MSGCTSIVMPFCVRMITCSFFCLFRGLSSKASMHWWAISGRRSEGSRCYLVSSLEWSSELSSSMPRFVCAVSNDTWSRMTRSFSSLLLLTTGFWLFKLLTSFTTCLLSAFSVLLADAPLAVPLAAFFYFPLFSWLLSKSDISKLSSSDDACSFLCRVYFFIFISNRFNLID